MLLTVILVPTLVLTLRAKAHHIPKTGGYGQGTASGQYSYPPAPEGVTVVHSKHHPDVTLSYKQNHLCETTKGVKSIAGYIHLPPGVLDDFGTKQDYPINSFFWFFESRHKPSTAPISLWMNGGPGTPSMTALFSENGPCWINKDSSTSRLNEWSWNNNVNMLYFDQPTQTGYSYDTLTNGTLAIITTESDDPNDYIGKTKIGDAPGPDFVQNATHYAGVFPSNNLNNTANTTEIAAQAFWHFAQIFFEEFEQYKPDDNKLSIWTESYGGKYGPTFAATLEEQTDKVAKGEFNYTDAIPLHVGTLGIINGCVDDDLMLESWPRIAYNNTYGLKFLSDEAYEGLMANITAPGGIRDMYRACAAAAKAKDPDGDGDVQEVSDICYAAEMGAYGLLEYDLPKSDEIYEPSSYDLANDGQDPLPENYFVGFLNDARIQRELGVPVNFTSSSDSVYDAFLATGDEARPGVMDDLSFLLSRGIRVAMVYGDRDMICNWYGGETVSLNINHTSSSSFKSAGYTDLVVNSTYVGGKTREYGNLSFTRVYDAGHMVPWYQPEAAHVIFTRAMTGKDIATGKVDIKKNKNHGTKGPASCDDVKNKVPAMHPKECYLWAPSTCTEDQWKSIGKGEGAIKNFILQK